MLRVTGQTVGLRLNFVVDTHGWPGGVIDFKNSIFFILFSTVFLRGTPGPSASLYNKTIHSYIYMLPIAGQTAGTIGLTFFVDTH